MSKSIKARTTKSARRDVSGVIGRKIRGDQQGGQLGLGHWGQAQDAVARSMSSFHLICCRFSNVNFNSNLTFRKHGLIQLSLLSLLLHYATHHCLPLTVLFHLFSFISLSYSCHISSAPNLFLSISLLLYFSLLRCLVIHLFLMVTLLHSISLHIRCG